LDCWSADAEEFGGSTATPMLLPHGVLNHGVPKQPNRVYEIEPSHRGYGGVLDHRL
jgi:hypothetical protein